MTNRLSSRLMSVVLVAACLGASVQPAYACAVCFGDPESGMAKGVVAGVWVLLSVVGFVLVGIAGVSLFWVQRSRMIAGAVAPESSSP